MYAVGDKAKAVSKRIGVVGTIVHISLNDRGEQTSVDVQPSDDDWSRWTVHLDSDMIVTKLTEKEYFLELLRYPDGLIL